MYDLIKIRKEEAKKRKEKSLEKIVVPMEDSIWLPNLSFTANELPEIKEWEVGKEYYLKVKVKMTSYSENKELRGTPTARGSFDVEGVEPIEDD